MDDLPNPVESDDEKFEKLMELQDPHGLGDFPGPKTVEDKYESQIFMDCVVLPKFEELLGNQEDTEEDDVIE